MLQTPNKILNLNINVIWMDRNDTRNRKLVLSLIIEK